MWEICLFHRKQEMRLSISPIPQGVHLTDLPITVQAISTLQISKVTSSEYMIPTVMSWLSIPTIHVVSLPQLLEISKTQFSIKNPFGGFSMLQIIFVIISIVLFLLFLFSLMKNIKQNKRNKWEIISTACLGILSIIVSLVGIVFEPSEKDNRPTDIVANSDYSVKVQSRIIENSFTDKNAVINATTSFEAEKVILVCEGENGFFYSKNMNKEDAFSWNFDASFYIPDKYTITIKAYIDESKYVTDDTIIDYPFR